MDIINALYLKWVKYDNSRKDCALIFTKVNLQHGWSKQK